MPTSENKKIIRIDIGEFYASKEPRIIQTVLGPCVAVCLFDPANRIGGMNHIFLPRKATIGDSYAVLRRTNPLKNRRNSWVA